MRRTAVNGPNPISPSHLRPLERRAELCRILALGLVRLRERKLETGDGSVGSALHNPVDRSGTAASQRRQT